MNTHVFTLITGASTGLGRELAIECAWKKMNLILVALPGQNLHSLSSALKNEFEIEVLALEADFSHDGAIEKLAQEVCSYKINFLINNAGIGGSSEFHNAPASLLDGIIKINIRAMTMLTRLLLPELMKHKNSRILNVSSMAAISPVAYKTIYPASKAFIYSFSRALNYELKDTTVSVTVVNPGPIMTNFSSASRILEQGFLARLGHLSAKEIAILSIKSTLKGKAVVTPGLTNILISHIMKIIPANLRIALSSNIIKRELNIHCQ